MYCVHVGRGGERRREEREMEGGGEISKEWGLKETK